MSHTHDDQVVIPSLLKQSIGLFGADVEAEKSEDGRYFSAPDIDIS
ncbi:hypothetical protein [Neptunomonas phycophila]